MDYKIAISDVLGELKGSFHPESDAEFGRKVKEMARAENTGNMTAPRVPAGSSAQKKPRRFAPVIAGIAAAAAIIGTGVLTVTLLNTFGGLKGPDVRESGAGYSSNTQKYPFADATGYVSVDQKYGVGDDLTVHLKGYRFDGVEAIIYYDLIFKEEQVDGVTKPIYPRNSEIGFCDYAGGSGAGTLYSYTARYKLYSPADSAEVEFGHSDDPQSQIIGLTMFKSTDSIAPEATAPQYDDPYATSTAEALITTSNVTENEPALTMGMIRIPGEYPAFRFNGYTVKLTGYRFDGMTLSMTYEVSYDNDIPDDYESDVVLEAHGCPVNISPVDKMTASIKDDHTVVGSWRHTSCEATESIDVWVTTSKENNIPADMTGQYQYTVTRPEGEGRYCVDTGNMPIKQANGDTIPLKHIDICHNTVGFVFDGMWKDEYKLDAEIVWLPGVYGAGSEEQRITLTDSRMTFSAGDETGHYIIYGDLSTPSADRIKSVVINGTEIRFEELLSYPAMPGEEIVLDNFIGLTEDDVRTLLKEKNMNFGFHYMENAEVPKGIVFKQEPPAGQTASALVTVDIYVSSGGSNDTTPDAETTTTVVDNGVTNERDSFISIEFRDMKGEFEFTYYIDGELQENMTETRDMSDKQYLEWNVKGTGIHKYEIFFRNTDTDASGKLLDMDIDFSKDPPERTINDDSLATDLYSEIVEREEKDALDQLKSFAGEDYCFPLENWTKDVINYRTHDELTGGDTSTDYRFNIPAEEGEPILAVKGGTVIETQPRNVPGQGEGIYITIQAPDGRKWRYSHLSDIFVSEGDTVKAGDRIAAVGATGWCTGPIVCISFPDSEVIDPAGTGNETTE